MIGFIVTFGICAKNARLDHFNQGIVGFSKAKLSGFKDFVEGPRRPSPISREQGSDGAIRLSQDFDSEFLGCFGHIGIISQTHVSSSKKERHARRNLNELNASDQSRW
jgi:hypothetical protein